jgi:hypothetical protein
MQTPDFWSVPFAARDDDGGPIDAPVRAVLAAVTGAPVASVPERWTDSIGTWCTTAWAALLAPAEQLAANRALGLLP